MNIRVRHYSHFSNSNADPGIPELVYNEIIVLVSAYLIHHINRFK